MKGYRFYLEYQTPRDKRGCVDMGNVFALEVGEDGWPLYNGAGNVGGIGAVYRAPNSPVCSTTANMGWVHTHTKRISEKEARRIHPALFEWLDYEPETYNALVKEG